MSRGNFARIRRNTSNSVGKRRGRLLFLTLYNIIICARHSWKTYSETSPTAANSFLFKISSTVYNVGVASSHLGSTATARAFNQSCIVIHVHFLKLLFMYCPFGQVYYNIVRGFCQVEFSRNSKAVRRNTSN